MLQVKSVLAYMEQTILVFVHCSLEFTQASYH